MGNFASYNVSVSTTYKVAKKTILSMSSLILTEKSQTVIRTFMWIAVGFVNEPFETSTVSAFFYIQTV